MPRPATRARVLYLIGGFKLFKGLLLFAVALGALKLMHRDMAYEVARWADVFRIDHRNRHVDHLLARLANLDEAKLKALSVGTFFYSALLLAEGTGLLLRKVWAEYFTILATSSFIPLEVYELVRRFTFPKVLLLLLNLAIVAYLIIELYLDRKDRSPSKDA